MLSAFVLFVITKLIGKKQFSQLDIFDYVTGITIGSIGAELATELEDPLKPLTAMIAWGAVSYIPSAIEDKFNRSRKYINGSPCMLMDNGKPMKKAVCKIKDRPFRISHDRPSGGIFRSVRGEIRHTRIQRKNKLSALCGKRSSHPVHRSPRASRRSRILSDNPRRKADRRTAARAPASTKHGSKRSLLPKSSAHTAIYFSRFASPAGRFSFYPKDE